MIRCGPPRGGSIPINRPTRLILPDATVGIVPGGPHGLAASEAIPRNQNTPRGTPLPSGVARAVPRHDLEGRSSELPTPSRAVAFPTSATEAPRVWGVGSDLRALAAFRIEHTDPEVESLSRDHPISGRSRRGREEASEVACRDEGASQAQAAKEDLARQIGPGPLRIRVADAGLLRRDCARLARAPMVEPTAGPSSVSETEASASSNARFP
jgi:hypothetical protein